MKIKKLNKELLNIYYKNDGRVYAQKVDNKVYVTDSYRAWILNEEDFMLDINKLKSVDLSKFFDDSNHIPAIKTNQMCKKDKYAAVYITDNEGLDKKALVNEKYFDLFNDYTLAIKDERSPIYVYESGEMVGLVLPMREF